MGAFIAAFRLKRRGKSKEQKKGREDDNKPFTHGPTLNARGRFYKFKTHGRTFFRKGIEDDKNNRSGGWALKFFLLPAGFCVIIFLVVNIID
jgi:hypothetical protein